MHSTRCTCLMLPIVEYESVVWDVCSEQDSVTLQNIQNEAATLVTGLTRSVLLESVYKVCEWAALDLSQRRQQHKLSAIYNVNTGMVPSNEGHFFYFRRIGLYLYKCRIYGTISIYILKRRASAYQLI